jgi:signal peptidase II
MEATTLINKQSTTNQLRWLWLTAFIFLIDHVSKILITKSVAAYQGITLTPFLNLILRHNYGASFSFLSGAGGWQRWFFVALAVVISIVILKYLYSMPKNKNFLACALALILGGAIGNLFDRLTLGYVIDFIDFHINTWHFATFNIADSAITIGVIMWLLSNLKKD